jgi:hypothetical protein
LEDRNSKQWKQERKWITEWEWVKGFSVVAVVACGYGRRLRFDRRIEVEVAA